VQLTAFRNARAGSPRWSPDGQIAFDSNATGNWDIYLICSQGGQPSRLTMSGSNEFQPSWSRDGKWIYYCSTRTGHAQVWKVPAAGGTEVQVTRSGGSFPFESVNGEELYYTNADSLWKMPVRGGSESRVLESLLMSNFVLTKHGVFFVERSREPNVAAPLGLLDFGTHFR
jgi:Tol biopolymer transport system component